MLDLPSISTISAAIGVLVGVALTILELRDFVKTRRTDAFWRIFSSFNSREYLESYLKTVNLEFKDYEDFAKKYGSGFSETPVQVAFSMVCNLFEGAGNLLHRGLVDFETVSEIPVSYTWEKVKPIVDGMRREMNLPDLWTNFEYLYNEIKRFQQSKKG